MTPTTILLGLLAILGIYAAGHWHGAIAAGAKAASARFTAAEKSVASAVDSVEESMAADAAALLARLADTSSNKARIAKEEEAIARKGRLLAELRAKFDA